MKNWKTTLFGALAGCMVILTATVEQLGAGADVDWLKVGLGIAIAIFGYFAKDFSVSGVGK
jgi:hypothetical protein